ncbi:hypothetical protein [Priestia koreensis]|uniref:hypothetical protein n=1 Tax=Priestia koreensis TaxID=284581 RepID=UPI001F5684CA|nr:hypothetical protein [Priestia koreensis]MCM3006105.1 hypothetical protein [Priestia koreensis]UNL86957.1 hypothetical protein IE339_10910 [Priestia koreensis]
MKNTMVVIKNGGVKQPLTLKGSQNQFGVGAGTSKPTAVAGPPTGGRCISGGGAANVEEK